MNKDFKSDTIIIKVSDKEKNTDMDYIALLRKLIYEEVSSLDEWGVNDSMIQHDVMNMHSDDDLNNLFRKYNT